MAAKAVVLWLLSAIEVATVHSTKNVTREQWEASRKAERESLANKTARESKMAAVNKVIDMLQQLQAQVMSEGEAEAATYDKFACFCKDTTADRLQSIQQGEDQVTELTTSIGAMDSRRSGLDTTIQTALGEITRIEGEVTQASDQRHSTFKLYSSNNVDLAGAVEALQGAIQTLKSSKNPSLVQVQAVSNTVRTAALLADALGLGAPGLSSLLQQAPPANEVQMEDYKYHSDGIIETLESLLTQFKTKKNEVDAAEVDSVRVHELLLQEKAHEKETKERELAKAREDKSTILVNMATSAQEMSVVQATLREDKAYTNVLAQLCTDKAKTWDQRKMARANELTTLTQAIGIIQGQVKGNTSATTVRLMQHGVSVRLADAVAADAGSMEAIEAEAEDAETGGSPVLVQIAAHHRRLLRGAGVAPKGDGRDAVVQLLKAEGRELQSTLLTALASRIDGDSFSKVKQLIQELIERLQREASNEATQKGWCDKATVEAEQKREFATEEIATLNAALAKYEADIDRLSLELGELSTEITDLNAQRTNATSERAAEKVQNQATVDEAQAGLAALEQAIELLDRFYKTMANNNTVDLSLVQGPVDDAPSAGFGVGEAYTGAQAGAGGVLAMLEVMKSDFFRTVTETEKAEAQAEADHLAFMTESGKALAQAQEAHGQLTDQHTELVHQQGDAKTKFQANLDKRDGAIRELLDLKPVCVDTGMTYSERAKRREDEIASLNKAMCILGKYEQFGPDGAGECGL